MVEEMHFLSMLLEFDIKIAMCPLERFTHQLGLEVYVSEEQLLLKKGLEVD